MSKLIQRFLNVDNKFREPRSFDNLVSPVVIGIKPRIIEILINVFDTLPEGFLLLRGKRNIFGMFLLKIDISSLQFGILE